MIDISWHDRNHHTSHQHTDHTTHTHTHTINTLTIPHTLPTHWPYHAHQHTAQRALAQMPVEPEPFSGQVTLWWNLRWGTSDGMDDKREKKKKNDLSLVAWGNRRALTGQRTENTTVSQGLINGDIPQNSTGSPVEHSWSGPQNSTGSPAEHSWPQQFNGLVLSLVCSWGPSRCDQSWPSCWQKDTLA